MGQASPRRAVSRKPCQAEEHRAEKDDAGFFRAQGERKQSGESRAVSQRRAAGSGWPRRPGLAAVESQQRCEKQGGHQQVPVSRDGGNRFDAERVDQEDQRAEDAEATRARSSRPTSTRAGE